MSHHIIDAFWHLPMLWDLIIPLAILAIFCAVLFWEGEYGRPAKKHFRIRFSALHH